MKQQNFPRIKVALRSAFVVMLMMTAAGSWAQNTTLDAAASKLISNKMSQVAEGLASLDGAKVESLNGDNGLPSILVTFDAGIVSATGNNELTEAAKTQLSKLATTLVENKSIAIEVLGHSDNSKWRNTTAQQSVQRNIELSEKRAQSVVNYLKSRGVTDSQIKLVEGKGESVPVGDNNTATGRAANRRVEVFLLPGNQMVTDAIAESRPKREEPKAVVESRQTSSETTHVSQEKPQKESSGEGYERGDLILFANASSLDLDIFSVSGFSTTDLSVEIGAAYFILDKLALTGELMIGFSKATDMDAVTTFGLGVGARYYLLKGLFAGAKIAGMKTTGIEDFVGAFGGELGYDIFVNDHVFFESALNISKAVNFNGFEMADGINGGLSIGIGIKF